MPVAFTDKDVEDPPFVEGVGFGVSVPYPLGAESAEDVIKRFDPNQPRDERGRWTDTGAGESRGRFEEVSDDILTRLRGGGFTVDRDARFPTSGFMVAPRKDTERKIPLDDLKWDDISDYIDDHWDLLDRERANLGGWVEEGFAYLDVSLRVEDIREAFELAKEGDQIAFFDLSTFTTYYTKDLEKDEAFQASIQKGFESTWVSVRETTGGEQGRIQIETSSGVGGAGYVDPGWQGDCERFWVDKFDASQPRYPAGHPFGGQWRRAESGDLTIYASASDMDEVTQEKVWEMFESTYREIGLKYKTPGELWAKKGLEFHVITKGKKPIGFNAWKRTEFGLKAHVSGQDGSRDGKEAYKDTLEASMRGGGFFGEYSHAPKHILLKRGVKAIPSGEAKEILKRLGDSATIIDEITYFREIKIEGKPKRIEKSLFGKPKWKEKKSLKDLLQESEKNCERRIYPRKSENDSTISTTNSGATGHSKSFSQTILRLLPSRNLDSRVQHVALWKFDPDQPRDPEGSSTGGQWTARRSMADATLKGNKIVSVGGQEEVPSHLAKLRIPPAWTDVRVNTDPEGDLLVVGKDKKGRRQAVYSEAHSARKAIAKYARIRELISKVEEVDAEIDKDLKNEETRDKAAVLKLIRATGMRPGALRDRGGDKQAFGAVTLLAEHVVVSGDSVSLQFTGKKGVDLNIPVKDKTVAAMLKKRKSERVDKDRLFNLSAKSFRSYVKDKDGGGFTPKDFRTLKGTEIASRLVAARMTKPTSQTAYKKAVREVAGEVAATLGNTPTVALQSYIDPTVFTEWRAQL